MERISFPEWGVLLAWVSSLRSEDEYTRCGAVAFDEENKVLSLNYNGFAPKQSLSPEFLKDRDNRSLFVWHAENNLLSQVVRGQVHTVCLNYSPCKVCAVNISCHGVKRVFFSKEYHREQEYKKIFDFYNIEYKELGVNGIKWYLSSLLNNLKEYEKVED